MANRNLDDELHTRSSQEHLSDLLSIFCLSPSFLFLLVFSAIIGFQMFTLHFDDRNMASVRPLIGPDGKCKLPVCHFNDSLTPKNITQS